MIVIRDGMDVKELIAALQPYKNCTLGLEITTLGAVPAHLTQVTVTPTPKLKDPMAHAKPPKKLKAEYRPPSYEYPYGKGNQGPGTGPMGERLI